MKETVDELVVESIGFLDEEQLPNHIILATEKHNPKIFILKNMLLKRF